MDLSVTIQTLLAFFGGITVIAGGIKVIFSMLSPFKLLNERMNAAENRLDTHDGLLRNDRIAIDELTASIKENRRTNIALLNHFIDGNGKEKMQELRDDIQSKM